MEKFGSALYACILYSSFRALEKATSNLSCFLIVFGYGGSEVRMLTVSSLWMLNVSSIRRIRSLPEHSVPQPKTCLPLVAARQTDHSRMVSTFSSI